MNQYCEKELITVEKALDFSIRDYEIKHSNDGYSCGFFIEDEKRTYWNYMSEESWEKFKDNMSDEHKTQFENGGGQELEVRNSRWGKLPPKMASFGSSSRMIYRLSNKIPGFEFEKQLPTHVGHDANLDGYFVHNDETVFVEAKCREIYASHAKIKIGIKYKSVYNELRKANPDFNFEEVTSNDGKHFICTFCYKDTTVKHFDIKQLICHFLGITGAMIEKEETNKKIKFVYLIFNPNKDTDFSSPEISDYKRELIKGYEATLEEIDRFGNLKWLFDSIMKYQSENLKSAAVDYTFDFEVMDQEEYKKRYC